LYLYFCFSQSKQTLLSLFVEYCLPHTLHVVFRIKNSLSSPFACPYGVFLDGKTIAFLRQRGAQAEQRSVLQPPPHLDGYATFAFPFSKVKTPFGQNSTQRGFPVLAQPSHLSEKIIGTHGQFASVKFVHFLELYLITAISFGNVLGRASLFNSLF
jgi:hypothetical protein